MRQWAMFFFLAAAILSWLGTVFCLAGCWFTQHTGVGYMPLVSTDPDRISEEAVVWRTCAYYGMLSFGMCALAAGALSNH